MEFKGINIGSVIYMILFICIAFASGLRIQLHFMMGIMFIVSLLSLIATVYVANYLIVKKDRIVFVNWYLRKWQREFLLEEIDSFSLVPLNMYHPYYMEMKFKDGSKKKIVIDFVGSKNIKKIKEIVADMNCGL